MTRSIGGRSKAWQPVAPGKRILRRPTLDVTRVWEFATPGGPFSMVVPARARVLTMECYGAVGEYSSTTGALGGYIKATVLVIPGETLYVRVGGNGYQTGTNGGGGGGTGLSVGGRGGGASDVRRGTATSGYETRLIAAGGGGGRGGAFGARSPGLGGVGGGLVGADGTQGTGQASATGTAGKGGTQTTGGAAGAEGQVSSPPTPPEDGTLGVGGRGENAGGLSAGGGGGGGGWYGGGGGAADSLASSGGGGGSSGTTGTLIETQAGVPSGNGVNGFVRITWPY